MQNTVKHWLQGNILTPLKQKQTRRNIRKKMGKLAAVKPSSAVKKGRFVTEAFNQLIDEYGKVADGSDLDAHVLAVKKRLQPLLENAARKGHYRAQKYLATHFYNLIAPSSQDVAQWRHWASRVAKRERKVANYDSTYQLLKFHLLRGYGTSSLRVDYDPPDYKMLVRFVLMLHAWKVDAVRMSPVMKKMKTLVLRHWSAINASVVGRVHVSSVRQATLICEASKRMPAVVSTSHDLTLSDATDCCFWGDEGLKRQELNANRPERCSLQFR